MSESKKKLWYNSELKKFARELRNNSTLSEVLLWKHLKGKQMCGFDFHRQKPIGYYIVDFFCAKLMLAIELDGSVHDSEEAQRRDAIRQQELEDKGIRFLRFRNEEVLKNMKETLTVIERWIEENGE